MDALEREHGVESVAYEMLGPPRLSKLLWEAAILGRLFNHELQQAAGLDAEKTAAAAEALVDGDADLRRRILSIGLPILLPEGDTLLRGPQVKVSPEAHGPTDPFRLADRGWVDLRPANWERWRGRVRGMLGCMENEPGVESGSRRDIAPWEIDARLRPGALAAWVFRHEDAGERIKR